MQESSSYFWGDSLTHTKLQGLSFIPHWSSFTLEKPFMLLTVTDVYFC